MKGSSSHVVVVPFSRARPFLACTILLGVCFFGLSAFFAWSRHDFLTRAVEVPGEVAAIENRYRSYVPVVTYLDHTGTARELHTNQGTPKPLYFKGEKLTVVYDPMDPDFPLHAKIKDFHELWAGPVVLAIMGFLFVTMPSVIWLASTSPGPRVAARSR
jgi:Protein of unknown function (DUF3592)